MNKGIRGDIRIEMCTIVWPSSSVNSNHRRAFVFCYFTFSLWQFPFRVYFVISSDLHPNVQHSKFNPHTHMMMDFDGKLFIYQVAKHDEDCDELTANSLAWAMDGIGNLLNIL